MFNVSSIPFHKYRRKILISLFLWIFVWLAASGTLMGLILGGVNSLDKKATPMIFISMFLLLTFHIKKVEMFLGLSDVSSTTNGSGQNWTAKTILNRLFDGGETGYGDDWKGYVFYGCIAFCMFLSLVLLTCILKNIFVIGCISKSGFDENNPLNNLKSSFLLFMTCLSLSAIMAVVGFGIGVLLLLPCIFCITTELKKLQNFYNPFVEDKEVKGMVSAEVQENEDEF